MARGTRRAGRGESTTPVSSTLGPTRRASRAAQRSRRRRQRRTRTSVVAFAGIALAVVVVAVVVGSAVKHDNPAAPKGRTQRTLLLEVTGADGAGRAAALLAYDPTPRAALVLIPPHTLADVAGLGNVVLASAVRLGGPGVAREAVSDLMGVLVDQDWTLTSETFAVLVDRVGGVVVDVDTDVVVPGRGGTSTILVRAGSQQRLDGATALAYATYVAKGQDEITFQARFQAVLDAVVSALPADDGSIAATLGSLGPGSRLSWRPADLAAFLQGVRAARAADRYEPQVLPVSAIETGSGSVSFGIKVDEVGQLVRTQLADSLPPNRASGDNRVLILNGVGTPGLGADIARRLRDEFQVVGTRNKQPFGVRESVVVVFDSSDPSLAKARRVAALLGLPAGAVRIGTQTQSVADVIVVVGSDYKR